MAKKQQVTEPTNIEPPSGATPADVLAELVATKTGETKLAAITEWIKANPEGGGRALLSWAEDQYPDGVLGKGTIYKIGILVVGDHYGMRIVGEANSDELERLRAEVNDLRKQLAASTCSAAGRAGIVTADRARIKTLDAENLALRDQLAALQADATLSPAPRVRAGKPTKVGGAMAEAISNQTEMAAA